MSKDSPQTIIEPRKGMAGMFDRLMGPGASPLELRMSLIPAGLGAIALIVYSQARELPWQWWQTALASLLAFDIMGGIATNATPSAKRWFFRKGQGFNKHLGFVISHVFHVFMVAWLFMNLNLVYLLEVSAFLVISAALVLKAPKALCAATGLLLCAMGFVLSIYVFPKPPGMEWFAPLLFLKLLVSHLATQTREQGAPLIRGLGAKV